MVAVCLRRRYDSNMTAANNSNCSCELCRPNWHLGEDGDFVTLTREEEAAPKRENKEAAEQRPAAPPLVFANN